MNKMNFRNKQKVLLLLFTFCFTSVHSQQRIEQLTKAFDSVVGTENLPLINGTFHLNTFRVVNEKNRYYDEDYQKGNVAYDGEQYFDVNLKYDLYEDVLIVQPFTTSRDIGVNLIPSKTLSFKLDGKDFVNFEKYYPNLQEENISGFLEEVEYAPNLRLFIKYYKDYREKNDRSYTYYEFYENHDFYLLRDGNFREITSRRDVYKIFPEYKDQIKSFYKGNKDLANSNEVMFFKNLAEYLSNLPKNNSF